MKKFLCAVILVAVMCSASFAAAPNQKEKEEVVYAGILTYLGTTEQEFQRGLDDLRKAVAPLIIEDEGGWADGDMLEAFIGSIVKTRRVISFYDSLLSMQMALRSRRIDEMALPEAVGMYLVTQNPNYDILFSLNMMPSTISFGFKRGKCNEERRNARRN